MITMIRLGAFMNRGRQTLIDAFLTVAAIATLAVLLHSCEPAYSKEVTKDTRYSFTNAKYLETYDGDTFRVDVPSLHPIFGKRLSIRVRGIDTPEIRSTNKYEKALGYKAKAFTKNLMDNGKKLRLTECSKGSFSRIVCKVSNSKTDDLGAALLEAGLAEIYKK